MKASDTIIMIGAPDSGKTNYLGRLWRALTAENASLRATQQPDDVRYVLDVLTHLLQGSFAPHRQASMSTDNIARFRSLGSEKERQDKLKSSFQTYRANFGQTPYRRTNCRRLGWRASANLSAHSCLSGSTQTYTFLRSIG